MSFGIKKFKKYWIYRLVRHRYIAKKNETGRITLKGRLANKLIIENYVERNRKVEEH